MHYFSAVYMLNSSQEPPLKDQHTCRLLCTVQHTFLDCDCLTLQVALKCADIGHLAAIPDVHKRWAYLLEEEFFLQVTKPYV